MSRNESEIQSLYICTIYFYYVYAHLLVNSFMETVWQIHILICIYKINVIGYTRFQFVDVTKSYLNTQLWNNKCIHLFCYSSTIGEERQNHIDYFVNMVLIDNVVQSPYANIFSNTIIKVQPLCYVIDRKIFPGILHREFVPRYVLLTGCDICNIIYRSSFSLCKKPTKQTCAKKRKNIN